MTGAECGESATTGVSWQVWRLVIGNCSKRSKEMRTHLDQQGSENQSVWIYFFCTNVNVLLVVVVVVVVVAAAVVVHSKYIVAVAVAVADVVVVVSTTSNWLRSNHFPQRTSPLWMGLASPTRTLLTLVSGVWSLYFFLSGSPRIFLLTKMGKYIEI